MAVVSRELIWRLRAAELAFNQHYLSVVASIDGNPRKADYEETPWGALLHMSGSPNNHVFNRAVASGPGMLQDLERIEMAFVEKGVRPNLEISAGDVTDEGQMESFGNLVGRGYKACEIEGIFYGETSGSYAPASERIEIRRVISPEDIQSFLEVYLQGWNYPIEAFEDWKTVGHRLWGDEKFFAFLALIEGRPAGCAQLYLHESAGYFADACVLPEERRQGCQRALFDARLQAARAAGCDLVFSMATFASQSAKNMEAFGLRVATELWHWRKDLL